MEVKLRSIHAGTYVLPREAVDRQPQAGPSAPTGGGAVSGSRLVGLNAAPARFDVAEALIPVPGRGKTLGLGGDWDGCDAFHRDHRHRESAELPGLPAGAGGTR
ncbi:MAG: hypothetical protein V8R40_03900 [Dysosmobacter sp.]